MTTYSYVKQVDIPRLTLEIQQSNITIVLDHITTVGTNVDIVFRADLSVGEKTTLDTIVENHSGLPLPTEAQSVAIDNMKINGVKQIMVDNSVKIGPIGGGSITINSHDWGDRTTWYQKSVLVSNETLVDSGNGLTFTSINPWWINMDSDKITYDYKMVPERDGTHSDISLRRPIIKVNDIIVTNYMVDYVNGKITFGSSQVGQTVTGTYYTNNNIPRCSEWLLYAPTNWAYILDYVEIQFSKNINLSTTVNIEIWGGGTQFGTVPDIYQDFNMDLYDMGFGQNRSLYRSAKDFLNICTNRSSQIIPAFAGLTQDVYIFPFDYLVNTILKHSDGAVIVLSKVNDLPYTNAELATLTFYMQLVPESSL